MSEDGISAHTVTVEKNHFHSVRHSSIWKAVNSKLKALGRKTVLQVPQNKETKQSTKVGGGTSV